MGALLRRVLLAALCALTVCASLLSADTTFFLEQALRTLRDLDLALAAGEITQEEYDLLLESLLQPQTEAGEPAEMALRPALRGDMRYRSTLTQDLDGDAGFVRYDYLNLKHGRWKAALAFEDRDDRELLIRSRSLGFDNGSFELTLGSYSARLGTGLTCGGARYHSELRQRKDFTASLTQPVRSRFNGAMVSVAGQHLQATGFVSYLEGETATNLVRAGELEYQQRKLRFGVVGLQQQVRDEAGRRATTNFLAPYLQVERAGLVLRGESSFGLEHSAAHDWSIEHRGDRNSVEIEMFSYGSHYHNLQSGGYAYSDYERVEFNENEFSYRDKISGRLGVRIGSSFKPLRKNKVGVDLVRWRVRPESREAAAGRVVLESTNRSALLERLRLTLLWENLDLRRGDDLREVVSLSTSWNLSRRIGCRFYQKYEHRVRGEKVSYPLRLRGRIETLLRRDCSEFVELNYYDPNLDERGNSYIYVAAGQRLIRQGSADLEALLQSRYHFGDDKWENWELRLRLSAAI